MFHRHKWEVVGGHLAQYVWGKADCTALLYRCGACGEHKTETINGHWPELLVSAPFSSEWAEDMAQRQRC